MPHGLVLDPLVQWGLAVYYALCAVFNVGFAYYWVQRRHREQSLLWFLAAGLFGAHALLYLTPLGAKMVIAESVTHFVDTVTNAVSYFVLSTVAFIAVLAFRKTVTAPAVAFGLLDLTLLAFGWAMTNEDFRKIVAKEANIPIVMLL